MNVQWLEIPWGLNSQYGGDVAFNPFWNGVTGPQWLLSADGCAIGPAMRVTRDNSPQQDGEIVHRHFRTGTIAQLKLIAAYVENPSYDDDSNIIGAGDFTPVCGADLVDLDDALMACLFGMQNIDGSLNWTPGSPPGTGSGSELPGRTLYATRWLGPDGLGGATFTATQEQRDTDVFVTVQFALLSPYPYAAATTLTTTSLPNGTPVEIRQDGTCDYFPVVNVFGPSDGFTLTCENSIYGTQQLVYNSALPGASPLASSGDTKAVQINMFANTLYFGPEGGPYNGDPANAGVDVTQTYFWVLTSGFAGINTVTLTGATGQIIYGESFV